MVPYNEVFPLADVLELEHEGKQFLVDDHYCCRPGCGCTSIRVWFVELDKAGRSTFATCHVKFDYSSAEQAPPEKHRSKLNALIAAYPNLASRIRRRHEQMRLVGQKLSAPRNTPFTAERKTGRNDSCPCGSGKKFKKCCGASRV